MQHIMQLSLLPGPQQKGHYLGVKFDRLALSVHNELLEVPGKVLPAPLSSRQVALQELVHFMGIRAINIHFIKHREGDLEVLLGKVHDFLTGAGLLGTKLVARERQYLKPVPLVLLIQLFQACAGDR